MFSLYRILFYSGISLDRFHCIIFPDSQTFFVFLISKLMNRTNAIFILNLYIDPLAITTVLHSSGTFVSGNNTLSSKMTLENY